MVIQLKPIFINNTDYKVVRVYKLSNNIKESHKFKFYSKKGKLLKKKPDKSNLPEYCSVEDFLILKAKINSYPKNYKNPKLILDIYKEDLKYQKRLNVFLSITLKSLL